MDFFFLKVKSEKLGGNVMDYTTCTIGNVLDYTTCTIGNVMDDVTCNIGKLET